MVCTHEIHFAQIFSNKSEVACLFGLIPHDIIIEISADNGRAAFYVGLVVMKGCPSRRLANDLSEAGSTIEGSHGEEVERSRP